MTPIQAMFWQIWRGWRWGLIAGWAYMLLAAVAARLLPDILRHTHLGDMTLPKAGQFLAFPCEFILIHLLAVFSITGADIKERGYWSKMFVLPVRTRTLVAWPMVWGCLALGSGWLFVAGLILRPTGNAVPLVWPIAALAAGLTLLQAISWMPLAQNWLSIVIADSTVLALATVIVLVAVFKVSEPIAIGIFLGLLPLTCAAGLRGVALARRGDTYDWQAWNRFVAWLAVWRKPAEHPFRSAERAQFWFECRSFAWTLPLMIAMFVPFFAVAALFDQGNGVALAWKQMIIFLLLPAFLATIIGSQLGNASFPFLAARPVSSAAPGSQQVRNGTGQRGGGLHPRPGHRIAFLPLTGVIRICPPGGAGRRAAKNRNDSIHGGGPPRAAYVEGPRREPMDQVSGPRLGWSTRCGFGISVLFCVGIPFGLWFRSTQNGRPCSGRWLPWFVGLLLTVKLIIAAWVLYAMVRFRHVTYPAAGLMIGVWALIVAGMCVLVVMVGSGTSLVGRRRIAFVVLWCHFHGSSGHRWRWSGTGIGKSPWRRLWDWQSRA